GLSSPNTTANPSTLPANTFPTRVQVPTEVHSGDAGRSLYRVIVRSRPSAYLSDMTGFLLVPGSLSVFFMCVCVCVCVCVSVRYDLVCSSLILSLQTQTAFTSVTRHRERCFLCRIRYQSSTFARNQPSKQCRCSSRHQMSV
ncbi:MAG: hypothetical protein ACK41O_27490, partial [Runella zeae]